MSRLCKMTVDRIVTCCRTTGLTTAVCPCDRLQWRHTLCSKRRSSDRRSKTRSPLVRLRHASRSFRHSAAPAETAAEEEERWYFLKTTSTLSSTATSRVLVINIRLDTRWRVCEPRRLATVGDWLIDWLFGSLSTNTYIIIYIYIYIYI